KPVKPRFAPRIALVLFPMLVAPFPMPAVSFPTPAVLLPAPAAISPAPAASLFSLRGTLVCWLRAPTGIMLKTGNVCISGVFLPVPQSSRLQLQTRNPGCRVRRAGSRSVASWTPRGPPGAARALAPPLFPPSFLHPRTDQ
ncbi:hypothetical protein K438DRAFT_1869122, partial [Mycena galopus ATCC 62051]